ncbi:MAG: hypothetical protein Kow0026_08320 [Oricola sp.]
MTDRPILFSAPMVKALLAGKKTQTRRVLKPQVITGRLDDSTPYFSWGGFTGIFPDDWFGQGNSIDGALPYAPGDRLWVKEAHFLTDNGDADCVVYAADEDAVEAHRRNIDDLKRRFPGTHWDRHLRLRPSIHMPKWASRITLVVTDVRVQRVQEISVDDAIAEGIDLEDTHAGDFSEAERLIAAGGTCGCRHPEIYPFRKLWNSINADRGYGWDQNPWVVAISFTVHKQNIDAMRDAV